MAVVQRGYQDHHHRPSSYNDLPQPEGSWEENYNNKQSKYNKFMGASALALVGTIIYVSVERKTLNFYRTEEQIINRFQLSVFR